jgi:hypothetical protein
LSAGQQESPQLRAAVQDIADEGKALRPVIDAQGSVSPTPLRQALDDAAVGSSSHQRPFDSCQVVTRSALS